MGFKPNAECFEFKRNFFIYKLNSFWKLLYYHDFSTEGKWSNVQEANHSIKSDKYSILDKLDSRYKINGKYEFLLEYPEVSGYNRWTQTSNPHEEKETNSGGTRNAENYSPVSISWND